MVNGLVKMTACLLGAFVPQEWKRLPSKYQSLVSFIMYFVCRLLFINL